MTMLWAKLYADWAHHPKAVEAGAAACGVWSRLIAYTAQTMRPLVPTREALILSWHDRQHLDRLVEVGLLETASLGYLLHDWEEWQEELHAIAKKKAAEHGNKVKAANTRWEKERAKRAATMQPNADTCTAPVLHDSASGLHQPASGLHELKFGQPAVTTQESTRVEKREIETENEIDLTRAPQVVATATPTPSTAERRQPDQHRPDVSDFGPFDPDRSWKLTREIWANAGPRSDERDLTNARKAFTKHINASNWSDFVQRLDWAVTVSLKQGRRDTLGVLYTFIANGRWKDQEPPFEPATPASAQSATPSTAPLCY
jgi:hypothetical protein